MEIINTYEETLSHYSMKLNHIEDELNDALKGFQELEILASEGWQGRAGSEIIMKLQEFYREGLAPKSDFDQIRSSLGQLGAVIEEKIRTLEEEAAIAAAAAAANM